MSEKSNNNCALNDKAKSNESSTIVKISVKNNLKAIMSDRGVKQIWLANKAGISRQTMSNLINNRFNVSLESAIRIAKALDLPMEEVFYIENL